MDFSKIYNSKLFAIIAAVILFFLLPYLWRRYRDRDIRQHNTYSFAIITKKTGSLINGNHWHYEFNYLNKVYEGHWPTHVDYDVKIGDFFLVNFSNRDPNHNKILYDYKLAVYRPEIIKLSWTEIPNSIVTSGRKKD